MRGMTQRSRIRETKSGQIAHFNHPFEMMLFNNTSRDEELANRPRLFVEVTSGCPVLYILYTLYMILIIIYNVCNI